MILTLLKTSALAENLQTTDCNSHELAGYIKSCEIQKQNYISLDKAFKQCLSMDCSREWYEEGGAIVIVAISAFMLGYLVKSVVNNNPDLFNNKPIQNSPITIRFN